MGNEVPVKKLNFNELYFVRKVNNKIHLKKGMVWYVLREIEWSVEREGSFTKIKKIVKIWVSALISNRRKNKLIIFF